MNRTPIVESLPAMFLEYNWTACCYQFRFGGTFTDVRGHRSAESLKEARDILATAGLKLSKKTDSRTWGIVRA